MDNKFILSCGSTVDLPYDYMQSRNIPVIFYSYLVDGVAYEDDMGRSHDGNAMLYGFLDSGALPSTSQINVEGYRSFFEPLVKEGDLLHIAFGSGMSASVRNAMLAAEMLKEEYPNRKIEIIDSLCSSSGYGMLVDYAADLRDRGASLEEVRQWVLDHRKNIHHQFFSTDLTVFRRSGRVSGAAAAVATVLNICPIMHLNDEGKIIAYDKVRGKKNAIKQTLETAEKHICNGSDYSGKLWICHSDCLPLAEELRDALEAAFPKHEGKIRICEIGSIIASHSGRGTVAAFFLGDERQP